MSRCENFWVANLHMNNCTEHQRLHAALYLPISCAGGDCGYKAMLATWHVSIVSTLVYHIGPGHTAGSDRAIETHQSQCGTNRLLSPSHVPVGLLYIIPLTEPRAGEWNQMLQIILSWLSLANTLGRLSTVISIPRMFLPTDTTYIFLQKTRPGCPMSV